jgi:hypothetical protein
MAEVAKNRKRTRASVSRECARLLSTTRALGVLVQRKVFDCATSAVLPDDELLKCLTWLGTTLRWMSEEKRKPSTKAAEQGENLDDLLEQYAKLNPERAGVMAHRLRNPTTESEH